MPKFPQHADRVTPLTGSVFEQFAPKMRAQGTNLIKLHIGDTYMHPVYDLPITGNFTDEYVHFNQYCNTYGVAPLRKAIAEKLRADNNLDIEEDQVMITNGATNALSVAVQTLINPGEDVLIITPAWPFFFGMVTVAGAGIIEAPLYMRLYEEPDLDILTLLREAATDSTVAIYVNTPNNPSGKTLNRAQLEQVAAFAKERDLWVISDEAYDGLTFDEREHMSLASLPGMSDRTLTIFTFSKIFMYAGIRLGFVTANAATLSKLNKIMVHQLYAPTTSGQYMMVEPVRTRHTWMNGVRHAYQKLRDLCADHLRVPYHIPEGGYFLFFPVSEYLNGREYMDVIGECLDNGVALAPGTNFGSDYSEWARLCFTGETAERLKLGLERLNAVLGV